jgi:uncharacterized membrane protein YdjX (TVP38/TMEM64 family)
MSNRDHHELAPETGSSDGKQVGQEEDLVEGLTAPGKPGRPFLRIALIVLVLALAMVGLYYSPVGTWLPKSFSKDEMAAAASRVQHLLDPLGVWRFPAFLVISTVLVAAGVPRTAMCFVGGAVLGFLPGLLLSQGGALMGYYGVFLFVRWGGREVVLHKWPQLQKWAGMVQAQGVMGVILIRQLPIHGTLMNLGLGLTQLRHRDFLIGTAIGLIPEAIPLALFGAGVVTGDPKATATYAVIAVLAFGAIWIGCRYMFKQMRRKASAAGK